MYISLNYASVLLFDFVHQPLARKPKQGMSYFVYFKLYMTFYNKNTDMRSWWFL
jgi:hypothetical protein